MLRSFSSGKRSSKTRRPGICRQRKEGQQGSDAWPPAGWLQLAGSKTCRQQLALLPTDTAWSLLQRSSCTAPACIGSLLLGTTSPPEQQHAPAASQARQHPPKRHPQHKQSPQQGSTHSSRPPTLLKVLSPGMMTRSTAGSAAAAPAASRSCQHRWLSPASSCSSEHRGVVQLLLKPCWEGRMGCHCTTQVHRARCMQGECVDVNHLRNGSVHCVHVAA